MPDRLTGPLPALSTVIREPANQTLRWTATFLAQLVRACTRHDWRGLRNVPATGGVILVVNHISNADPLVVSHFCVYAGRWPRFLAKASLFDTPVVGTVLRRCGQIPVRRNSTSAASSLDAAVAAVVAGRCVVVYPEGRISTDPDLWPMPGKTGAARIALATGAPVIPVAQWGAQQILYGNRLGVPRLLPRATMQVSAGPPIDLRGALGREVDQELLHEVTATLMAAIDGELEQLRGQPVPARSTR